MSFRGRNPRPKGAGKSGDLELCQVVMFLRFISVMTGALLIVSAAFFLLGEKSDAGNVAYAITILINLAACAGSLLGARRLDRKDRELAQLEKQKGESKYAV